MPSSNGSSQPRDWTQVSCIAGRFFTVWATCLILAECKVPWILLISPLAKLLPALTGSCGFVLCSGDSVPAQSMTALRTLALALSYHSPCYISLQVGACVPVCTWCYWSWAVIFNELFKEYLWSPCLRLDIILCVRAVVVKKASKSHSLEYILEGGLKPNPFVPYCSIFISDPKRSCLACICHGDTN